MKKTIREVITKHLINPVIDVFFPPICYICDAYLPDGQKIICKNCWDEIPAFSGDLDQSLINRSFGNIFILFNFEDKIRQIIHLLKYERHLTLAKYFALEAHQRFPQINDKYYHEIIPVPLYKTRKRERGYNQSEEIARAMEKYFKIPAKNEHLLRIRPTSSQTTMSREVREQNVRNAFVCPEKITGTNVLLVDDVITTGSTVEACASVLKNSGAHAVDVFTIAHPSLTD